MKPKILIAEDEIFIAENLAQIARKEGWEVIDVIDNMKSFNEQVAKNSFDAALLDIRMHSKVLGIEMGERLDALGVPFTFITSFSDKETIQSAVEHRPFGFIVKPFRRKEIQAALDVLRSNITHRYIEVKVGSSIELIELDKILYFQSENVYVNIFLEDQKIVTRQKLTDLLSILKSESFIRVHQSFCVNVKFIKHYSSSQITLANKIEIPVSRKYKDELFKVVLTNRDE